MNLYSCQCRQDRGFLAALTPKNTLLSVIREEAKTLWDLTQAKGRPWVRNRSPRMAQEHWTMTKVHMSRRAWVESCSIAMILLEPIVGVAPCAEATTLISDSLLNTTAQWVSLDKGHTREPDKYPQRNTQPGITNHACSIIVLAQAFTHSKSNDSICRYSLASNQSGACSGQTLMVKATQTR